MNRCSPLLTVTLFILTLFSLNLATAKDQTEDSSTWSAFPLAYSRTQTEPTPEKELHILWPFGSARSDATRSTKAIHPLWSWTVDTVKQQSHFDILWPLFSRRVDHNPAIDETVTRTIAPPLWFSKTITEGDHFSKQWRILFPLFFSGHRNVPARPATSFLILFPVWWQFNQHRIMFPLYYSHPDDSFAVWPFYGNFKNLFSFDRIRFVLWPLWVTSQRDEVRSYSPLWPFFNYTTGPGVKGWRVWPLVGHRSDENAGPRGFWLWPLGQHAKFQRGPLKGGTLNMFLPFWFRLHHAQREIAYWFPAYGYSRSADRVSQAWFWPVYTRTLSQKPVFRKDTGLWWLWSKKSGPDIRQWQAFIFAGWREEPGRKRGNVLWPIGQYRWDKPEGRNYVDERWYAVPFYARKDRHWDTGETDSSSLLWPFAAWSKKGSRKEFSLLRLFWHKDDDGIGRNWAPLWTAYSSMSDKEAGLRERRLFGPLFRSARNEQEETSEFNFLFFQYRREDAQKKISFLCGALPITIGDSGHSATE